MIRMAGPDDRVEVEFVRNQNLDTIQGDAGAAGIAALLRRAGLNRPAVLLLPALALLLLLFAYPIVELMKLSFFDPDFTTAHFEKFFSRKVYPRVFWNTVELSVVVTVLCFFIGYPAAYFLAHVRSRARPYLIFLILLPLWVSILIRSYSWMAILGREGLINTLLQGLGLTTEPVAMLYTSGAVFVAMAQILLPIMILTCYGVMAEIDRDLIKAARVLGHPESCVQDNDRSADDNQSLKRHGVRPSAPPRSSTHQTALKIPNAGQ